MQDQGKIKELFDNLSGYIDAKLELIKFDLKTDVSKVIINLLFGFLVLTLISIIFFLLSFGFAEYLNHLYESIYLGYMVLAGFYLILLITVLLLRKYTNLNERLKDYVSTFLNLKDNDEGR